MNVRQSLYTKIDFKVKYRKFTEGNTHTPINCLYPLLAILHCDLYVSQYFFT